MKHRHGLCWFLALVAILALTTPSVVYASLYELNWNGKWGSGDVVFDTAVPDSNPSPLQGDYFGAIVSYDVTGWYLFDAKQVAGTGGSISVAAREPGRQGFECDYLVSCQGSVLSFQLGSSSLPYDPQGWRLVMTVPWQLSAYGDSLPTRLEQSEAHPIDGSLLPNDPSGIGYGTINGNATSLSLSAISPPVPEPSTLLLLGMGLMGLGLRVRGTWLFGRRPAA